MGDECLGVNLLVFKSQGEFYCLFWVVFNLKINKGDHSPLIKRSFEILVPSSLQNTKWHFTCCGFVFPRQSSARRAGWERLCFVILVNHRLKLACCLSSDMRGRTRSTECAKQSPQHKFSQRLSRTENSWVSAWRTVWQLCSNPDTTTNLQRAGGRESSQLWRDAYIGHKAFSLSELLISLEWRRGGMYGEEKVADGDSGGSVVQLNGLTIWMGFILIIVIVLLVSFLRLGAYLLFI